jgi:hypothetical protein
MNLKRLAINTTAAATGLVRYNLKIIFANRFIFFLAAALGIFILVTALNILNPDASTNEGTIYWLLLVPGVLLVFYPAVFGIQNDVDTRIIEILFGIPDYRYKVWLLRLVIVFALTFFILIILSFLSSITLTDVPVISMAAQVMFPVLFFGSIAFMISTILTNGNAAAVVMIIGGIGLWIAQPSIGSNKWNPFLNPYNIPQNVSDTVWADIALQNRIYLAAVILAVLLYALLNLQKREKFMR